MLSPDLQRIKHILDYCNEIEKTIAHWMNADKEVAETN